MSPCIFQKKPSPSSETLKAMIRLEDALMTKDKEPCSDCISIRLLVVEQEALNELRESSYESYKELQDTIEIIREKLKQSEPLTEEQMHSLGQKIRKARKQLIDSKAHQYIIPTKNQQGKQELKKKCKTKIHDVMDPKLNIREIVKSLYLLQDHLMDKEKRCVDCMTKHSLIIEAYLDEAYHLDKKQEHCSTIQSLKKNCLKLEHYINNKQYIDSVNIINRMLETKMNNEDGQTISKMAQNYLVYEQSLHQPQKQDEKQENSQSNKNYEKNTKYVENKNQEQHCQSYNGLLEHPSSFYSFGVATL